MPVLQPQPSSQAMSAFRGICITHPRLHVLDVAISLHLLFGRRVALRRIAPANADPSIAI